MIKVTGFLFSAILLLAGCSDRVKTVDKISSENDAVLCRISEDASLQAKEKPVKKPPSAVNDTSQLDGE